MYKPTRKPLALSVGVNHAYFYFAQSEKLELNFFVLFLINNISRVLVVTCHCLSYHFVPQQKEKFRFFTGKCALESTCTIVLLLFQNNPTPPSAYTHRKRKRRIKKAPLLCSFPVLTESSIINKIVLHIAFYCVSKCACTTHL